jgi:hypothetical protein
MKKRIFLLLFFALVGLLMIFLSCELMNDINVNNPELESYTGNAEQDSTASRLTQENQVPEIKE